VSEERITRGNGCLPDEMQGRWVDIADPGDLVVDGFDVSYCGQPVKHDYFTVSHIDGALCVDLGINATDIESEDTFSRENVTHLVIDPDGALHAYNVKFASTFERAEA
jgi:hypothetical protein